MTMTSYERYLAVCELREPDRVPVSPFIMPFAVWIMRGFFQTIPRELEEAAMTDGCTRLGAFVRIILPLPNSPAGTPSTLA